MDFDFSFPGLKFCMCANENTGVEFFCQKFGSQHQSDQHNRPDHFSDTIAYEYIVPTCYTNRNEISVHG